MQTTVKTMCFVGGGGFIPSAPHIPGNDAFVTTNQLTLVTIAMRGDTDEGQQSVLGVKNTSIVTGDTQVPPVLVMHLRTLFTSTD